MPKTYVENFENGTSGWLGIKHNGNDGAKSLEVQDGALVSKSPWWVDYNHAPPGPGYINLLFILHTKHGPNFPELYKQLAGANRFVEGGFPTNFTNARITARLKGEVDQQGAELVILTVSKVGDKYLCHMLTGQPMQITPDWSEQSVTLVPDDAQWTALGSRHDRMEKYDWGPIAPVLEDLNCDIMFVLFPINAQPAEPLDADPHFLKAGEDYPLNTALLPSGYVMMDEVRFEFPDAEGVSGSQA